MQVIERYIFRRAAGATLITLCGLAGTLWVVQILREIDLVTTKGQAIWVFLVITAVYDAVAHAGRRMLSRALPSAESP
jgi:lipopolysaccharide export system permease protein